MKKVITLSVILILVFTNIFAQKVCKIGAGRGYTNSFSLCSDDSWQLVFEDNFDGNELDLSKWYKISGVPRDFDFKRQKAWHLPENVEVSNGTLKLIAKKLSEPYVGTWVTDWSTTPPTTKTSSFDYTTGEIWTNKKFDVGVFEARIKIPRGKGFCPAFWLFCGEPRYNEIDIFEFYSKDIARDGTPKTHAMTIHYDYDNDGTHTSCSHKVKMNIDFSADFHIFKLIWEKDKVAWYVDGELNGFYYKYYNIMGDGVSYINAYQVYYPNLIYTHDPMALILNLAVEHGDHGPNIATVFPSQMEVDWVRYYQQRSCGDVSIDNNSQYPGDDNVYNPIVGNMVNIGTNFVVPSGKQLNVMARDGIKLNSGFSANSGSSFRAKIDGNVCSSFKSDKVTIDNLPNYELPMCGLNDVKVYPNPNQGIFVVDFGMLDYTGINIIITNIVGQHIATIDDLYNPLMSVDLTEFQNGVYIVKIFNTNSLESISHKIIVQ